MLKDYPKFKRNEIEGYFEKIPDSEKKLIKDYLQYRRARGVLSEEKIKDIRRYILHIRFIIEKNYSKIDKKDLIDLLAIINSTNNLSDHVKNNLKIDLRNFLKYIFPDWSFKFNNFDDVKTHSNTKNERKINSKSMMTKEDVKKLIKHETNNFWKAFIILQYEGGLRTKEVRFLKWDDIKFNVDKELSEINIYSTKTKKARIIFVEEATFYLKELKKQQEEDKIKSVYVFPQQKDVNVPVNKTTVSEQFRRLTKRVFGEGHEKWNYLLRHSRATELYRLAEQGKISKDIAIRFMGHSSDMSKNYTHLDSQEVKEMLKNQIYKLEELPEEKKHELQIQIEKQGKEISEIKKESAMNKIMYNKLMKLFLEKLLGKIDDKQFKKKAEILIVNVK